MGGFSKVILCYNQANPNQKYAMKIVMTNVIQEKRILDQLISEIGLMVKLKGNSFAV